MYKQETGMYTSKSICDFLGSVESEIGWTSLLFLVIVFLIIS